MTDKYGEKQVASKLKNTDDSLLAEDSEDCKGKKSMSVLIKNMEMPKCCGECHFCHTENFRTWCCPTGREDVYYDSIPEWCPLEEQKSKLESVDTPTDTQTNTPTEDCISRQAAINAIENTDVEITAEEWDELANAIESLPPAEPKRPHGEWIEYIDDRNGRRYGKCSSCNKSTLNAVDYDVLDGERYIMDFCPNCGADMRGAEDD